MTTFGWKRKTGQNMVKKSLSGFSEDDEDVSPAKVSWVQSFKRKKLCMQENCVLKYEEFKATGLKFADNQKFKEAISEWDKALNLVPNDYKILEMKAQALLHLNMPLPAMQAAEKAVKYNCRWWVGYQTLGRAQLGIADLELAKRSFSKAIHLNPAAEELWEEDLKWTLELIKKKNELQETEKSQEKNT